MRSDQAESGRVGLVATGLGGVGTDIAFWGVPARPFGRTDAANPNANDRIAFRLRGSEADLWDYHASLFSCNYAQHPNIDLSCGIQTVDWTTAVVSQWDPQRMYTTVSWSKIPNLARDMYLEQWKTRGGWVLTAVGRR
eukprot:gene13097-biopygen11044